MHGELLAVCGYTQEEIVKEGPRIDRAFGKMGIDEYDVKRAERRIRELFDTDLEGMRKILGIWLRETIDFVLAKDEGKRLVYGGYPSAMPAYMAVMYASKDVLAGPPEMAISMVMGSFFDKLSPILEAAESNGLQPGQAHCGLLQARLGAMVKGIAPVPDFIMDSSFFCDQAPKVDELIHDLYGVPVVYMDTCSDQNWGDYPSFKRRRVEYFGARIAMALEKAGGLLGCQVGEEHLHKAVVEGAKVQFNFRTLLELLAGCDPLPVGPVDIAVVSWMVTYPPTQYVDDTNRAISTLIREAMRRRDQGKGVTTKGAPRVVWSAPSVVDPEVMRMVGETGVAVPFFGCSWLLPVKRIPMEHKILAERIAEGVLRYGPIYGTEGCIEHYKDICQLAKADGFVNVHFNCRSGCFMAYMIKKAMQDALGIPVLSLEYDLYDKRSYGTEQLRTRLETFAELVKATKVK